MKRGPLPSFNYFQKERIISMGLKIKLKFKKIYFSKIFREEIIQRKAFSWLLVFVLILSPGMVQPAEATEPQVVSVAGNAVCIPNGRYDPESGTVILDVTHFSDYAVAYNQADFSDVPAGAWYSEAVSFIAARDITTGTGGGNFSPGAKLTRGQFLVMLMKAYEIASDTVGSSGSSTDAGSSQVNPAGAVNFSDAGDTYYTGYLAAAKRLGISGGVGNNMFAPEKQITRQEMFTLLYNALNVISRTPQTPWTLDAESDRTLYKQYNKQLNEAAVRQPHFYRGNIVSCSIRRGSAEGPALCRQGGCLILQACPIKFYSKLKFSQRIHKLGFPS